MVDLLAEFSRNYAAKGKIFEAQIEITHHCNLKCIHCYIDQENPPVQAPLDQWKAAIDLLVDQSLCMINFTGGEPLLYEGLIDLISHAFSLGCQVRMFSNGNLFRSREQVTEFKQAGLCYFETSIYGAEAETHDSVTTVPGSFDRTIQAIQWVAETGIPVTAKTSWMSLNWRQYNQIVELARSLDVYFRGSPSIMPRIGGSNDNQQYRMTFEDMVEFYRMDRTAEQPTKPTPVSRGRAPGRATCGIGRYGIAIGPDGTIFPCIHFRSSLGNIFKDDITDLWANSPLLNKLRDITIDSFHAYEECEFKDDCFICMGDGWIEWGDPLRPSSETCMMARARGTAKEHEDGGHRK